MTARLATTTTTRTATSGTVETCRLTRSWNKTMGRVRWLLATNDSAEPSLHIDEAYEGALAVREQLRAAAKQYFVDIDELRQGNVRDIPLICEWQTERRGLDDVRVCTKVRAIDRNFPQWGIDDPDKFNLFMGELNVGAALYNEVLGYDRRRWPAYEECKRRMLDKLTVKPENIIPFGKHKDVPDAKDNPDWSVALGKVANMGEVAVADKTTLNEAFPRDDNNQPVDKPAHETDPAKCKFAMPAHIKRVHKLDDSQTGQTIRNIFNMPLPDALAKHGVAKCWEMIEAFDATMANIPNLFAPAEPPAPAAPETGAQAAQDTPPATTLPETPQRASSKPSSPVKGQPKDNPVTSEPDKKDVIRQKYNKPQRGNDYLMVQGRVLLLRLEHPDWSIETDLITAGDDYAVFKAWVRNADGRVIATGHGRATEGKTSNLGGRFIEKAETAAIGRALALAGFGTDDSLDDSDYLADSPVAKAA